MPHQNVGTDSHRHTHRLHQQYRNNAHPETETLGLFHESATHRYWWADIAPYSSAPSSP